MSPLPVVVTTPCLQLFCRICKGQEPVLIRKHGADSAVERLNEDTVRPLARMGTVEHHRSLIDPDCAGVPSCAAHSVELCCGSFSARQASRHSTRSVVYDQNPHSFLHIASLQSTKASGQTSVGLTASVCSSRSCAFTRCFGVLCLKSIPNHPVNVANFPFTFGS